MSINIGSCGVTSTERNPESAESTRLRDLVDRGAIYVPQALNISQFVTLGALLDRLLPCGADPKQVAARVDALLAGGEAEGAHTSTRAMPEIEYQVGLNELDTMARSRTGYSFADLTPEIQDAMLALVLTGDLTTRKIDLPLWLGSLHRDTTAICGDSLGG